MDKEAESGEKNVYKIVVKWTMDKKATGYQVEYGLKSDFSDATRAKLGVTGSKVIKGLKSGKKYYVRVRSLVTIDGKTSYSEWSKTVAVTVN